MVLESKQMKQKDHSSVSSNALLLVVVGKKDPSKPWNQSIRINYSKQYRRFCLPSWRGRRGCYHHYQGHGRGAQGWPHGAGEETKVETVSTSRRVRSDPECASPSMAAAVRGERRQEEKE